jgi:hypothetical protein
MKVHPKETLSRCSLRAQLRGDPMLGTAFPASRLMLVEQPGPWGRAGLRQSRMERDVADALQRRAGEAGLRVLSIRRVGRTPKRSVRRWAVVDSRPGAEWARWDTFDRDGELLEVPLDGSAGELYSGHTYLVCTHSKHDVCCAVRGRPVAAALAAERPDQVWECSHVGGERFAANVLVLPSGLLYGRVLPFAAPEFVATTEAGEVVGALLRGRLGLPPAAQAALAFAHEQLAVRRVGALRVLQTSTAVDGVALVRIAGPRSVVDVTVVIEKVAAAGLVCARPGPDSFLAYRPVRIVDADG